MRYVSFIVIAVFLITSVVAFAAEVTDTKAPENVAAAKVTISADETKIGEVLDSLAKQSKQRIIIESTVKGTVKLSVNDVPIEAALTAVCKPAKLQWRKIYISPTCPLLDQPDKFASTVRLMSGLSFPDMVMAGSSVDKFGVHFQDKKAVNSAETIAPKDLGMTLVYLVTNDAAVAEKSKQAEKDKAVDEYTDLAKKQLDAFMKMTPEEREKALVASINLMDQVDPSYMAAASQALMNTDPDTFKRIQARSTEMMFSMSQEDRRRMIKFGMQMQGTMTPEQIQMLQEDSKAVMEELAAENNQK
ncbi:MAG: hypothetical protein ABFD54_03110 [Armatimonadota bacterium]|nr:hypothetical protein [bacterium]